MDFSPVFVYWQHFTTKMLFFCLPPDEEKIEDMNVIFFSFSNFNFPQQKEMKFKEASLQKSRILFLIRFFFGNIKKILDDNAQNQVRMCSSQHTVLSVYKLITETRSLDCVINIIRCYIPFNVYYVRQCRAELYGMEWKTK